MILTGCDESLKSYDEFFVKFMFRSGNRDGLNRPGLLGASRQFVGSVEDGFATSVEIIVSFVEMTGLSLEVLSWRKASGCASGIC